jgi:hypothetical protein
MIDVRDLMSLPQPIGGCMRLFAVTWLNTDGPDSVTLVEAERPTEAKERVLKAFHAIDMDKVTIEEFAVNDLGPSYADLSYLVEGSEKLHDITINPEE